MLFWSDTESINTAVSPTQNRSDRSGRSGRSGKSGRADWQGRLAVQNDSAGWQAKVARQTGIPK